MKKLLYITDQQEYSEHGTIGALFHGYLKQYMTVHVVYFTKYKHSFQIKGDDFIVPEHRNDNIIDYLLKKEIDIASYDFVFVRNIAKILENVLHYRSKFHYKVGFRASFAKSSEAYERSKLEGAGWLKSLQIQWGNRRKDHLLNQVDLFMPTSTQMQRVFYPNVTCKVYPLLTALNPATMSVREVRGDAVRRFIYVGSLDPLREFEVVLDAFNTITELHWSLSVSVYNPKTIRELLKLYPKIRDRVSIDDADELAAIKAQVCGSDVGLALLPDRDLYNNALSAKVVDYYACAVPALLSDNTKNRSVFEEGSEALFSPFESEAIAQRLKALIDTDEETLIEMGRKGQTKLIAQERSYDVMAAKLAKELESL